MNLKANSVIPFQIKRVGDAHRLPRAKAPTGILLEELASVNMRAITPLLNSHELQKVNDQSDRIHTGIKSRLYS